MFGVSSLRSEPMCPGQGSRRRPTPCHRSWGTSDALHRATQMSRGEAPWRSATSPVTPPSSVKTRSCTSIRPYVSPNSSATAIQNSLRRTTTPGATRRRDSADRHVWLDGRLKAVARELALEGAAEIFRNSVGNDIEALDDRHAITDLVHDDGDRSVKRFCD